MCVRVSMACTRCVNSVFDWCCGYDSDEEHSDDSNESLEERAPVSTFWTKREEKKLATLQSYTLVDVKTERADQQEGLDSRYDPDEEYVKNFDRLGWHTDVSVDATVTTMSSKGLEALVSETEQFFTTASTENLTPREITATLNRYSTCIRFTTDIEKKRNYIQRYEIHKFDFDEDNKDDKDKAALYLGEARNVSKKSLDRIEYYQTAIKFTNDYGEKQKLKEEYRRYAFSLTRRI